MSNYEYANGTGLSVLSQQIFEHLTPLVESVKVFFLASYDRENPPKIGKYIENEDGNSIWATEDNAIFAMEPWSDTPPERLPGMYLWTYTEAIFKDGSIYNSDPVCLVTWDDIDNAVNGMTASLETGLALKADKATTYTKTEVDNFVDTGAVTSEAANPLVIEADAAQYAKKTHLTLAPVQDLHGYDHPWPAGGGKNLLDKDGFSLTIPPTDTSNKEVGTFLAKSGVQYTFSCNQKTAIASSERNTLMASANGTTIYENTGRNYHNTAGRHSLTFTSNSDQTCTVYFWGHTLSASTVYDEFQVEVGSSATSYAPYSNICPITPMGHRNLLPITVEGIKAANGGGGGTWRGNTYAIYGLTFELEVDGDGNVIGIKVNGTASYETYFWFQLSTAMFSIEKGSILTGCPRGGSGSTYGWGISGYDWDYGNGAVMPLYDVTSRAAIWVNVNVTINNLIFTPMIRLASDLDSTFVPYGMARVGAKVTGFNLWDEEWEVGNIDPASGRNYSQNNVIRIKNYISVKSGATYNIHAPWVRVFYYDMNKNYISYADPTSITEGFANYTITIPNDVAYMRFRCAVYYGTTYNNDICINISDAEKNGTYEPYKDYTASLDLPEEVYSGTLDLETGELVADMGSVTLGNLDWSVSTPSNHAFRSDSLRGIIKPAPSNADVGNAICDSFFVMAYTPLSTNDNGAFSITGIADSNSGRVIFVDNRYSTIEDFVTGNLDTRFVYELATPITYQLTPQQLALFKGINNISTNAKTVQVTYRNGELATTGDIVESTEVAKKNILGEAASDTDAKLAPVTAELTSQAGAIGALNGKNTVTFTPETGVSVVESQLKTIGNLLVGNLWISIPENKLPTNTLLGTISVNVEDTRFTAFSPSNQETSKGSFRIVSNNQLRTDNNYSPTQAGGYNLVICAILK